MPTLVEAAKFHLPHAQQRLDYKENFSYDLELQTYRGLPELATDLGFKEIDFLPTRRAVLQIYNRPHHLVPNFPKGATLTDSALALYRYENSIQGVILRTQDRTISLKEFEHDCQIIARHYMERPAFMGFPSRAITHPLAPPAASLIGITIGIGSNYLLGNGPFEATVGAAIGSVSGPVIATVLKGGSEIYARRQISSLNPYLAGGDAGSVLIGERSHEIQVAAQKQLFEEVKRDSPELTPEEFLKMYSDLWKPLRDQQLVEVERTKFPRPDTEAEPSTSLPQLVEAYHTLQIYTS